MREAQAEGVAKDRGGGMSPPLLYSDFNPALTLALALALALALLDLGPALAPALALVLGSP